ncbi:MAG: hypothetical protein AB1664_16690 [Thermodesulfobacteriota bacterium]
MMEKDLTKLGVKKKKRAKVTRTAPSVAKEETLVLCPLDTAGKLATRQIAQVTEHCAINGLDPESAQTYN